MAVVKIYLRYLENLIGIDMIIGTMAKLSGRIPKHFSRSGR